MYSITPIKRALGLMSLFMASHCFSASPPNIVIILTDDMGFSDVGSYGGEINTPNIDRLAYQGVRFSSFYNTARCSTTRASLLTGRYPHNVQMGHLAGKRFSDIDGYRGSIDKDTPLLPEWLSAQGYKNYMLGKWHLGNWSTDDIPEGTINELETTPLKRGFDNFYGTLLGGNNYFDPKYFYNNNEPINTLPDDFYYTDALSQAAVAKINKHKAKHQDQPFFMYLAYTAPHWPLQAPAATIDKYREVYRRGWNHMRQARLMRQKELGLVPQHVTLAQLDDDTQVWDERDNTTWMIEKMAVHAAMVEHVDQGVGLLLETLETQGELDNTLVLFMSDNGASGENLFEYPSWALFLGTPLLNKTIAKYQPAAGDTYSLAFDADLMAGPKENFQMLGREWAQASNTPYKKYKSWVHEGGIASPLIVHWPKALQAQAGRIIGQPAHVMDIMPTITSIVAKRAERPTQTHLLQDGLDLLPAIQGQVLPERLLFFEHEGHRAVISPSWKLVAEQGKTWELYNRKTDRTERNNVADEFPERVETMAAAYKDYAKNNKVKEWSEISSWF